MKTLFIAALVGLLVLPVVGNPVQSSDNGPEFTDLAQIQSYRQANKIHQSSVDRLTKALFDTRDVENGFKAHAKNAPDKIQRDQLLAWARHYEKQRKQLQKDIAVAKRKIRDNQRKICGLYNAAERLKHRACKGRIRGFEDEKFAP